MFVFVVSLCMFTGEGREGDNHEREADSLQETSRSREESVLPPSSSAPRLSLPTPPRQHQMQSFVCHSLSILLPSPATTAAQPSKRTFDAIPYTRECLFNWQQHSHYTGSKHKYICDTTPTVLPFPVLPLLCEISLFPSDALQLGELWSVVTLDSKQHGSKHPDHQRTNNQ